MCVRNTGDLAAAEKCLREGLAMGGYGRHGVWRSMRQMLAAISEQAASGSTGEDADDPFWSVLGASVRYDLAQGCFHYAAQAPPPKAEPA